MHFLHFYYVLPKYEYDHQASDHWQHSELASFDKDSILRHVREEYIGILDVKLMTPMDIVNEFKVQHLDILMIDAQGYDCMIADEFLKILNPNFIMFEGICELVRRKYSHKYVFRSRAADTYSFYNGTMKMGLGCNTVFPRR